MSALPVTAVRVVVPGSTANLGSGFDALGMALSLHDAVSARVVDGAPGTATVSVRGQGAGALPGDERHLVVRVVHDTLAELGFSSPPALELHCENNIPHSRGLGSSAAAIIAGIAIAHGLAGLDPRDPVNAQRALHLAALREGHADNVAASLHGGFVLAWREPESFRAVSLRPHADIAPVALVPQVESSTRTTRGLLPDNVPHADAAFAAGRAALTVEAITRRPDLLLEATEDRLHQDYREPAWPETVALMRKLRAAGIAAAVSGAGPTVLALPVGREDLGGVETGGFQVLRLPVDTRGVQLHVEG
ncbi:homoserine kinase [Saccharopolyspora griseoalba]|uniref:Homoserine kinase n=1 Tax=Saccharopolyspora griseoalba TaxID=1431848 RepID=A0ABW2LHY9_9PSEU